MNARLLDRVCEVFRCQSVLVSEAVDDAPRPIEFEAVGVPRYQLIEELCRRGFSQLSVYVVVG